jgi:predicted exporter
VSDAAPPGSAPPAAARPTWRWWLGWSAAAIVLIALALTARFTTDLQKTLPTNDADLNRILDFVKERGASRMMALEAWPEGSATVEDAANALTEIGASVRPFGATPLPQPGPEAAARMVQVVEDHLPVLVTSAQLDEVAKRMEPKALREYLTALKERASRPDDLMAGTASRGDVLWVGGAPLLSLQESFSGTVYENGIVHHPDGKHLLLPLTVAFDPADVRPTKALMQALDAQVAAWAPKGIRVEPIGSYRHFDDNMSSLFIDFFSTIPLGVAMIVLVLWSLARSWRGVGAMYLPAGLGLIGAAAAVAVTDRVVPLPLIGFAASLLGVAVDYGVQMTFAARSGDHRHVHRPLVRSFVVSACAFGALSFSPVPALHTLGVMVFAGLGVAYISARWLLPTVVATRPRPDPWGTVSRPLLRWCERHPSRRLLIAGLITLALAPGLMRLHFLSDIQRMDGSKPTTRAALQSFLARWGSLESSNYLVATAPDLDGALRQAAEARHKIELPPSRLELMLPDEQTQRRRQADWNRFWSERGPAFAGDFAAACTDVHLRAEAFAPSLDKYRPREEPVRIVLADWRDTPMQTALKAMVSRVGGAWQVSSPIEAPTPDALTPIEAKARQVGIEPAWIASRKHLAERLVEVLRTDLANRAVIIAIAIAIAIAALVRSPRPILAMLLPPALAMLWTFGLLGLLGQELTPFTVLVAAFVGGIGIDCAVFLAHAEDRTRLLTPAIGCIATAVAGTGTMLFAHHPLLAGVGGTLTIGMTACLAASLLVTPAIARPTAPRDGAGPPSPGG